MSAVDHPVTIQPVDAQGTRPTVINLPLVRLNNVPILQQAIESVQTKLQELPEFSRQASLAQKFSQLIASKSIPEDAKHSFINFTKEFSQLDDTKSSLNSDEMLILVEMASVAGQIYCASQKYEMHDFNQAIMNYKQYSLDQFGINISPAVDGLRDTTKPLEDVSGAINMIAKTIVIYQLLSQIDESSEGYKDFLKRALQACEFNLRHTLNF